MSTVPSPLREGEQPMQVGDKVTSRWLFGNDEHLKGTIDEIRSQGPLIAHPERTHRIHLDIPHMGFDYMWFDPTDLIPGEGPECPG